eukprot:5230960-Pleurochrysis_carterae.AAC.5
MSRARAEDCFKVLKFSSHMRHLSGIKRRNAWESHIQSFICKSLARCSSLPLRKRAGSHGRKRRRRARESVTKQNELATRCLQQRQR